MYSDALFFAATVPGAAANVRPERLLRAAAVEASAAGHASLVCKRIFDIVFGTPLIVAIPAILGFAVAAAVTLRTWPFFVQQRIGRGGRVCRFPKLRTLPRSAPQYASKYQIAELRVPRVLRFMRRRHLDELPQLLRVPLGLMSLVGPRPKMPDEHEPIEQTYGRLRVPVPQGCTGLWQIGAHACRTVAECPQYDFLYLRYGCLRLDVWIIYRRIARAFL